MSKINEDAAKN